MINKFKHKFKLRKNRNNNRKIINQLFKHYQMTLVFIFNYKMIFKIIKLIFKKALLIY